MRGPNREAQQITPVITRIRVQGGSVSANQRMASHGIGQSDASVKQLDISKAICNVFTSKNQYNQVLKIESTKYEAMIAVVTVTAPVIYNSPILWNKETCE